MRQVREGGKRERGGGGRFGCGLGELKRCFALEVVHASRITVKMLSGIFFCNRGNKTIYCTFCCFLPVSFLM